MDRKIENYIERLHGSTAIVPQEVLQLTTPSVFSSADQPSTPHPPSAMLQRTCHWHFVAPTADSKRKSLPSALFLPFCEVSSLALPQDPSPSCSILTFGRLSFVDHTRAFFSSGDYSTVLLELAAQYQDVWT